MWKVTLGRYWLTCRPSQMRRCLPAAFVATPSGKTQWRSLGLQRCMVCHAMPFATFSETNAAFALAEGWLRRMHRGGGPVVVSHSSLYPEVITDRVVAQTIPIWCMVANQ